VERFEIGISKRRGRFIDSFKCESIHYHALIHHPEADKTIGQEILRIRTSFIQRKSTSRSLPRAFLKARQRPDKMRRICKQNALLARALEHKSVKIQLHLKLPHLATFACDHLQRITHAPSTLDPLYASR
jgi:hypothetical protein